MTLFHGFYASDMPTYRPRRLPPRVSLSDTDRLYSLAVYGGLPTQTSTASLLAALLSDPSSDPPEPTT